MSTLGNYIEYNVHAQEDLSPSLPVSVSVTVTLCVISA